MCSVAVSADARRVAAGGTKGRVCIWETDQGAVDDAASARLLGMHGKPRLDKPVSALIMTEDGDIFVSGGADCTVRVWRLSDQALVGDPIETEWAVHLLTMPNSMSE